MKTSPYAQKSRAEFRKQLEADEAELAAETKRMWAIIDPGHLYVIEFDSGVIKVGKSAAPTARVARHARLARAHGAAMRDHWISHLHFRAWYTEHQLIAYCSRVGQAVAGREYFRLPFRDAWLRGSILAHCQLTPDDVDPELLRDWTPHEVPPPGRRIGDGPVPDLPQPSAA